MHLVYEDHTEHDPGQGFRLLSDFLGLQFRPVKPDLMRMNPQPVAELLENHAEVARVLKGTEFEWMLG